MSDRGGRATRRPWIARALLALALVLFTALPSLADRAAAEYFAGRGEKALDADKADEAEEHFRRALQEDETYHPARFGLARTLLAADREAEGLIELKASIEGMRGESAWKSVLARAEKLLDEVDRAGADLRRIVEEHADALTAFARKWSKKDRDTAVRALWLALGLCPGHVKASDLISSLGHSPKGPPVAIFDGSSLDGWVEMGTAWKLENRRIVGDSSDNAYISRSLESFSGDYDVRMEARLVATHEGSSYFALCPAFDGQSGHYALGILKGRFLFQEDLEDDTDREFVDCNPPHDFEPTDWHVYEMRLRGSDVSAYVDGTLLGKDTERPETRRSGFVGLIVQFCRFEIRRIDVTRW